ncbi:MAG: DUF6259 domain-containing protein, partial [Chitinivibrionales bacterium]|nr:DUF6259 domain-containing protein [Chitinivibrionales bacterium]
CMMPFELIELDDQGIYFGTYDDENNTTYFLHEFAPGFLDSKRYRIPETDEISGIPAGYVFTMVRTPFLQPGEKIKLAPAVFTMYEGDWHEGIKPYIAWRESWYKQKPQPAWAKDADCWHSILMTDPVGTIGYTYQDLIGVAEEAKLNGVKVLQVIGWNKGGLDGALPYFETDPRLGTREEFKEVIQKIEKSGVHILLMCKFPWADVMTPEFENEIKQYTVKDFYGKNELNEFSGYQTITGSGTAGSYLCPLSADFRKFAVRQLESMIDLGVSGIQNDQIAPGGTCFDTAHHHRFGESRCKGAVILAEDFYRTAQQLNKEFLLTGEGPSDQMSQYYPVGYMRSSDYCYWYEKHVPVWKYLNPDMLFATCLLGWDDREMVNQCLTYGYIINYEPFNYKGRLKDIPATVAYGRQALELRSKLADYIWHGRFQDTQGARVTPAQRDHGSYYSVFQNRDNGKKAVVITNDHAANPITVRVALPGKKARFTIYSIGAKKPSVYKNACRVGPRSLLVLVEQ